MKLRMTTVAMEEAVDDSSSEGESFGRWQRQLYMAMSWMKEASYVFVGDKGSYGPLPQR